jgi:serine/threonine protein kinase
MILERSARALDEAHQKAIFHGGLSPAHMALDEAGSVKVLNLGLHQAVAEALEGKNTYLPDARYQDPRRMSGCLDAAGDIYALGCVFHFLLTAEPPWKADSPEALTTLHREAPVPLLSERFPEHGAAIDTILTGCLAKNPEWRYRRAQELADELRTLREKLSEQQASESVEEIGRRVKKSHRPKQRGKERGTEEATHLELGKTVSDRSFGGLLRLTLFAALLIVVAVLAWRFLPGEGNVAGNGAGRTYAFTKASDLEIFTTKDGTIDFGSSGIEGPGPFAHLVSQPLLDGKEWTLEWTLDLAETTQCSIAVVETGHSVLLLNLSPQKLNLSIRPPGGTSDTTEIPRQGPWPQPITLRLEGSPSKTILVVNGQRYAAAATLSGLSRASIDISFAGGFWRLSRMEVR